MGLLRQPLAALSDRDHAQFRDCSINGAPFLPLHERSARFLSPVLGLLSVHSAACPTRFAGGCEAQSVPSRCFAGPSGSDGYFAPPRCSSPGAACRPRTSTLSPDLA